MKGNPWHGCRKLTKAAGTAMSTAWTLVTSKTQAPLLERIDLTDYLNFAITSVSVGGESGDDVRICRYKFYCAID